jgi:transcriptional regulator with XRE-family HTH domain
MKKGRFGEFFRQKRLELRLTLRQFCRKKGYDAGYISRMESGLLLPPKDIEKLKALATALEIKEQTPDWVLFFDLAATEKGEIPKDIKDFSKFQGMLPAFYRTLRKKKVTEKDIKNLLKLFRQK